MRTSLLRAPRTPPRETRRKISVEWFDLSWEAPVFHRSGPVRHWRTAEGKLPQPTVNSAAARRVTVGSFVAGDDRSAAEETMTIRTGRTIRTEPYGNDAMNPLQDFSISSPSTTTWCSVPIRRGQHRGRAFTLIELLVVIAIIAILAGMLLPALARAKVNARIKSAKTDMANIKAAIIMYEAEYHRYPVSSDVELPASGQPDFTFGFGPAEMQANGEVKANSEVMEILTGVDRAGGPNEGHRRNPRKIKFFNGRAVSGVGHGLSGLDNVFRDPWGTPYIITIDLDDDNKCIDSIYGKIGGDAFRQSTAADRNGLYELNANVMVWSFGPNRQADAGAGPEDGVNKDNVVPW